MNQTIMKTLNMKHKQILVDDALFLNSYWVLNEYDKNKFSRSATRQTLGFTQNTCLLFSTWPGWLVR